MRAKPRDLLTRTWQSQVNVSLFLFVTILLVFVFPSIGIERNHLKLYADLGFTVALIFGVGLAWESRALFVLTSTVSTVAIIARWVAWWTPTRSLILVSETMGLAAVFTVMTVLLWQVFRSGPFTSTRIQGAIAVYLVLAVGWAHAYHIAAILIPGSFATAFGNDLSHATAWVNFSFGMLTTLGYDGIAPIRPVAHSLCSGEAVTGQLYLAVLVARLVSMQVRSSPEGS